MRKIIVVGAALLSFFFVSSPAHAFLSLFGEKPAKFKIVKVGSEKKYLHLMTRTRGVLGTNNWGKFNYDVVTLPYEKQGEYFSVVWSRSRGPKQLGKDIVLRIEYKHQSGETGKFETTYPNPGRGRKRLIFENTGDRFVDFGEIDLWRVSLLVDNQVVAEKESALWWTVSQIKS